MSSTKWKLLLIRIASPQNYKERTNSAFSANQILDQDEFDGFADIIGYSVEITMETNTNVYSAAETRSAFGTLFLTAGVASTFFSNNGTIENSINLPKSGTPFEDDDKSYLISLNDVSVGPVNRTGNTGLGWYAKRCKLFHKGLYRKCSRKSIFTESNQVYCVHNHNSNQLIDPPGYQYYDILVIGGGGSEDE